VDNGGSCSFGLAGGTFIRLTRGKQIVLSAVPPAALIAAAPGRVAIVRAASHNSFPIKKQPPPGPFPLPAAGPLEVRDGNTGRLLQSFTLPAAAEAVAVTPSVAAVVVHKNGGRTLLWYGSHTGSLPLGNARVVALAADGDTVVVETADKLTAIDVVSANATATWQLGGAPAGLSTAGGHVLWAENAQGHGRILEAGLP
jgi:hypothetical protein